MISRIYTSFKFLANMLFIFYVLGPAGIAYSFWKRDGCLAQGYWASWACDFLQARFTKLPNSSEPIKGRKGIILVNHRSWSDFFVHDKITQYNANYLSRYLVGLAIPVAFIAQSYLKTLWFFRRDDPRKDFQKFYKWLDQKWANSKRENLLVYPEGHRMFESENPGQIKKGMLQFAFERKLPIQIAISHGNENLINEKKVIINRGTSITYFIDQSFESSDFADFDTFYSYVQRRFTENFQAVYLAHYGKKKQ